MHLVMMAAAKRQYPKPEMIHPAPVAAMRPDTVHAGEGATHRGRARGGSLAGVGTLVGRGAPARLHEGVA